MPGDHSGPWIDDSDLNLRMEEGGMGRTLGTRVGEGREVCVQPHHVYLSFMCVTCAVREIDVSARVGIDRIDPVMTPANQGGSMRRHLDSGQLRSGLMSLDLSIAWSTPPWVTGS